MNNDDNKLNKINSQDISTNQVQVIGSLDKTKFGSLKPLTAAQIVSLLMNSLNASAGPCAGPCGACGPCSGPCY